jgi:hypothetical protein
MLFDLATCVTPDDVVRCAPRSCADQGLACGLAGDGCGGVLQCGACLAPETCGGGGVRGECGVSTAYSKATYVRDYDASGVCPVGTSPRWAVWSWEAETPGESEITFDARTAATRETLDAAPWVPLRFSDPPGPLGLEGEVARVRSRARDTQAGWLALDRSLALGAQVLNHPFLSVRALLEPSADGASAPSLRSWSVELHCTYSE